MCCVQGSRDTAAGTMLHGISVGSVSVAFVIVAIISVSNSGPQEVVDGEYCSVLVV